MQVSKSEYMMFLKHPAWLWLKKHDKSKLPVVDDNTQAIFDAGNLFESYAEQLFPEAIRLGFDNYDEYLSLPERTQAALDSGATTLSQGRLEKDGLTFIFDILQTVEDGVVDLYEIKSSTKPKTEHEYDLAFQAVVLENCGFRVRNIFVIHVNGYYVRKGDVDPVKLTKTADITDRVKSKLGFTREKIPQALEIARSREIPDISPLHASPAGFTEWLEIYRSLRDIEPGSIYDLYFIKPGTLRELQALNIGKLADIPDDFPLSEKQRLQVRAVKAGKPLVKTTEIKEFLNTLEYPLYFLDYETLAGVVPPFEGMKPYQQLPFQYSLHIVDTPGAEPRHVEYLHRENSNPTESLSRSLQENIGEKGSVITWYAGFEKGCNETMGKVCPGFKEFYTSVNDRIEDLMLPFSNGWYADVGFLGRASLKNILPVLVPELSYKELDIQEGGSAQRLWMEAVIDGKRDEERQKILADLVKYCALDTLAMVRILERLQGAVSIPGNNPESQTPTKESPEESEVVKIQGQLF